MFNKGIILLFTALLSACTLIDYHPYDGKIDSDIETDINKNNIEKIESVCQTKDTIRFILTGDTQRSYDETEMFVNHINQQDSVDFVIHAGDYTEFGMKKEFEWAIRIFSHLHIPYVGLIGNHDIIGNGDDVYEEIFGNENFSFIAGDVKFVCINTNAIEYDYSHPVPDFSFLKNELKDSRDYKRTVLVMHAPPGNEQFDNNVKDVFQLYIKEFPSLMFCLHGHTHHFSNQDLFNDGIIYYGCSNIAKRDYLLFTITPDDYTYEVVHF